jgi:hypothetical protein
MEEEMKYKITYYQKIKEEIIEAENIRELYREKLDVTGEFNESNGEFMKIVEEYGH